MTVVETATGKVEGRVEGPAGRGVHAFRGIPYAGAPAGANRLRGPIAPPSWTGVRPAADYGAWAPQNAPATSLSGEAPGAQDEDCLTLNVWTPAAADGARPVLVWIHGGGFVGGSGASGLYDGTALAARGDAVVVTVNYRLGILGFLAHSDLADEACDGAAGNWGLLDQIAALRWVRDNIAAFGGDPANVTIFGESAGGMSVSDLLAMPSARGLFRRAIVQSGPPNAIAMDRAEETTAKLVAELGLASIGALRDVPVQALLEAQAALTAQRRRAGLPLVPVIDGTSLPVHPQHALADGAAKDVALLIGSNRDEAKMFMVADPANRDPDEEVLHRRIDAIFRANDVELSPTDVIDGYRAARAARREPVDPREIWSAIETDRMFRIGSIRAAQSHAAQAQAGHAPTYMYLFTWESPAMGGALGSCHALEIPFVFGTLSKPNIDRFAGQGSDADRLSGQMMDAWLAFARSGDPNTPSIPQWPTYDATSRATMTFGRDTSVTNAPGDDERRLWEDAGQSVG